MNQEEVGEVLSFIRSQTKGKPKCFETIDVEMPNVGNPGMCRRERVRLKEIEDEMKDIRMERDRLDAFEKTLKNDRNEILVKHHEWIWVLHCVPSGSRLPHCVGTFTSKERAESYVPTGGTYSDPCGETFEFFVTKNKAEPWLFDNLDVVYPNTPQWIYRLD